MKIQVIGSGSMRTKYNSACYLIDNHIMIDFPNGAVKYLLRLNNNVGDIDNILITHFHGDHYFDIPFYILYKTRLDNKNINLYLDKSGIKKIKKIGLLAFPNSFNNILDEVNLKTYKENKFNIDTYSIEKILVDHGRMKPAYGYLFSFGDKCVGFTGDTSLCNSVELMAMKCNYLFCDCTKIVGDNKHMGIDNIKYLSKKYVNCNFVISHMDDETRKKLEKLNLANVCIPFDGININVED